ncbi:hypothetical protein NE865_04217 [Phthorimaea operculella]|nr:hypothetical protein NE865_04217 [Phthorimaea operculella]
MGSKANDIISSLKLTKDEMNSYDTVKAKFESYYITKKTKMYARAQFNQRIQKEDETADDFITDLHKLGKKCEYGSLEDELVRDRIVAGMKNHELSKQIQNKQEEPTLQNVINRVRHAEVVEAGMGLLNQKAHGSTEAEVHQVQKKWNKPKHYENDGGPCRKCGKTPKHRFTECEAANSTCKTCGIKGHWMTVCRYNKSEKEGRAPRNVHQVEIQNNEDEFFFGTIDRKIDSVLNKKNKAKFVNIKVNDQFVRFKVDTGASDTVISPELHNSLNLPDPMPVDEKLWGPCKMLLPGRGVCRNVKMTWQGRTKATDISLHTRGPPPGPPGGPRVSFFSPWST